MLFRILTLMVGVSVLLSGCSDSDPKALNERQATALDKACVACSASKTKLAWLKAIIQEGNHDPAKDGFVYSFQRDGRVIFVYQPFTASCLACRIYDCSGDSIEINEVDHEDVISKMTEQNLIYDGTGS
jgi:hypothetical protein